jgi:hypothetical protein
MIGSKAPLTDSTVGVPNNFLHRNMARASSNASTESEFSFPKSGMTVRDASRILSLFFAVPMELENEVFRQAIDSTLFVWTPVVTPKRFRC